MKAQWTPGISLSLMVLPVVAFGMVLACAPQDGTTRTLTTPIFKKGASIGGPSGQAETKVAPLSPPATVRVGTVGAISDAGIYIAIEKGYFAEEGLTLELSQTPGGGTVIPALSTGQLDVAGVAVASAFYNAFNRDIPVKIVADKGRISPGHGFVLWVVRKDLADAGVIKDYGDLRGKNLGLNLVGTGTITDTLAERSLQAGGLARADANLVSLNYPDMNPAFGNKSLDAAIHIEPLATAAEAQGLVVKWKTLDQLSPNHQIAVLMYSPSFAQSEAAKRFMAAYVRGLRDYADAFDKNLKRDEVVDILTRTTTVKDPASYDAMIMAGLNPDGYVNADNLKSDLEYFSRNGYVTKPVDINQVIDNGFVDYAIQRLGRYR